MRTMLISDQVQNFFRKKYFYQKKRECPEIKYIQNNPRNYIESLFLQATVTKVHRQKKIQSNIQYLYNQRKGWIYLMLDGEASGVISAKLESLPPQCNSDDILYHLFISLCMQCYLSFTLWLLTPLYHCFLQLIILPLHYFKNFIPKLMLSVNSKRTSRLLMERRV